MAMLLYHLSDSEGTVSPFDEAVLRVARSGPVRVVSPYIGVAYLERIVGISPDWRLISDVQEWLRALSSQARPRAWQFIREHIDRIHHCSALHAKAVISDSLAMMGSANLTQYGILGRTEMGILLDDQPLVAEMGAWFESLWCETSPPLVDETSAYIQWLDEEASYAPTRRQRVVLSGSSRKVRARLVKLAPAPTAPKSTTQLDLGAVAQDIIAQDQKRYASLEAALEASIDKLTMRGSFGFGVLAAETRRGFPTATLREVYVLLVQYCANHVRSVFVENTHNRLVLSDSIFHQSTKETLVPALAPFDHFLAVLTETLGFAAPADLPTEEKLERATGFAGREQVILISELLDCGFLTLHDRPAELPQYILDACFDQWNGRFKLFAQAHAAWALKRQELPTPLRREIEVKAVAANIDAGLNSLLNFRAHSANGPYDVDFAAIGKEVRVAKERTGKHRPSKPIVMPVPTTVQLGNAQVRAALSDVLAATEKDRVDGFLANLLTTVARGRSFSASDWNVLVQVVAAETHVPTALAATALDPVAEHPKVFVVTPKDGQCHLTVSPTLSWDMLMRYPKTRAACDKLLS